MEVIGWVSICTFVFFVGFYCGKAIARVREQEREDLKKDMIEIRKACKGWKMNDNISKVNNRMAAMEKISVKYP